MRPLEAWGSFVDFTCTQMIAIKKKSHKCARSVLLGLTMMTLIFIPSFNDWSLFSFEIWRKDILLKLEHLADFLFSTTAADLFLNLNKQLLTAIWIPSSLYLSNNSKTVIPASLKPQPSESFKFNHMKHSAVLATFLRISISHDGDNCAAFLWGACCFY